MLPPATANDVTVCCVVDCVVKVAVETLAIDECDVVGDEAVAVDTLTTISKDAAGTGLLVAVVQLVVDVVVVVMELMLVLCVIATELATRRFVDETLSKFGCAIAFAVLFADKGDDAVVGGADGKFTNCTVGDGDGVVGGATRCGDSGG